MIQMKKRLTEQHESNSNKTVVDILYFYKLPVSHTFYGIKILYRIKTSKSL